MAATREAYNEAAELTDCEVVTTNYDCPFCDGKLVAVYPMHSENLSDDETPCGKGEHCTYVCADCKFMGQKNNRQCEILMRNYAINVNEGRTDVDE